MNLGNGYTAYPKQGTGRIVDLMPRLIAAGQTPITTYELMDARYLSQGVQKQNWINNYFDTGTAVAQNGKGRYKIVHARNPIWSVTPETILVNGKLPITIDIYNSLEAIDTFSLHEVSNELGRPLTRQEAKNNRLWFDFAGHERKRLDDQVDLVFDECGRRWDYNKNMGIYLDSVTATPTMRLVCVGRFYGRSGAVGRLDLDNLNGRLVGVGAGGAIRRIGRGNNITISDEPDEAETVVNPRSISETRSNDGVPLETDESIKGGLVIIEGAISNGHNAEVVVHGKRFRIERMTEEQTKEPVKEKPDPYARIKKIELD